jgi:hypothetical protein
MTKFLLASLLLFAPLLNAQQEGPAPTQALISLDSKTPQKPTTQNVSLKVNNRDAQLNSISPVTAPRAQVVILIDDGLRQSVGRNLGDLKNFVSSLRTGTEIFIGYMQNGRVVPAQEFTTDYAAAAKSLRIPLGSPGISASPYFCLSDLAKRWPASSTGGGHKARFVMMITNGVDPYNGSTSITNQNSPYVDAAVADSQRAGIAVYSIYYSDAGIRGEQASFSGQSYLSQVAEGTGGRAYFEGLGNPVSMAPFLNQFRNAIAETYVAAFDAPGNKELVQIKISTSLPGTKVRAPQQVHPGNQIVAR